MGMAPMGLTMAKRETMNFMCSEKSNMALRPVRLVFSGLSGKGAGEAFLHCIGERGSVQTGRWFEEKRLLASASQWRGCAARPLGPAKVRVYFFSRALRTAERKSCCKTGLFR